MLATERIEQQLVFLKQLQLFLVVELQFLVEQLVFVELFEQLQQLVLELFVVEQLLVEQLVFVQLQLVELQFFGWPEQWHRRQRSDAGMPGEAGRFGELQ